MAVALDSENIWRELAVLWRDLAAVALTDVDRGWRETIQRLGALFDAPAGSVGIQRRVPDAPEDDPLNGLRGSCVCGVGPGEENRKDILADWSRDVDFSKEPIYQAMLSEYGSNRVVCWRDAEPESDDSKYYELMRRLGVHDRMAGILNLDEDTEVFLILDRLQGQPAFIASESRLYRHALDGLRPVAAAMIGSYGYFPGQTPLAPREREVLGYLLGPLSEKQIAAKLDLATSSTHQIVVSIYRKLGVSSRPELMSQWVQWCADEVSP